jgi:hypothetical protein
MDVINFPQDLTQLEPDQLTALEQQINSRGEELSDAESSPESVDELELLSQQADAIDAENTRRETERADLDGRKEAAAGRFKKDLADPTEGDQVTIGENEEDLDEDGKPKAKAKVEAAPEPAIIDQIAAAVSAGVTQALAIAGVTMPNGKGGVPGNVAALSARQSARSKVREASNDAFMVATAHAPHMREGTPFEDPLAVASAIVNKRLSLTSVPGGTRDFVSIAHTDKFIEGEHLSQMDAAENFRILRDVQVGAPKALVASGHACAEYAPSYEFFRLAEPQNPFEQGTNVVQAPRGGINYIVPPSVAAAAAAIDISAQDRNFAASFVQFSAGPKACITVSCPSTSSAEVSAVSQCVTFDNLNYKVFPEQVSAFLEDVAVQFMSTKEVFYLDYVNSNSTAVTGNYCYGFSRSLLHDWVTATVGYRKRHGMASDATMQVAAPDWAREAVKLDMAMDGYQGLSFFDITDNHMNAALSARNIDAIWYNDNPTGVLPNQKFNGAQAVGGLNQFPTKVKAFIYAPGTFVRLDGGTLDVGLVRDSTLNRTNDLQLFMEEWIGIAKLGFESVGLLSTLCVNGSGPAGVTPCTCP